MKASLALILTTGFSPAPVTLAPISAVSVSLAPQALVSPAFSAPSLALAPVPALAPAPALAAVPALAAPSAPAAALPALSALTVLPAPSVGDAFDGAFAERREKAAEAVQYAHAEIPVVDYMRGAYGEERAREFMEGAYAVDEKTSFTGRELLAFLVTPEALDPDLVPDPDRVDFNRLGRTTARIRDAVEEKGMPYHPYERILREAFREGLIYRLFDKNTSLTHYGVPPRVRADWGLEPAPDVEKKAAAAAPASTAFSEALSSLAAEAVAIKDNELFEFTAQAVAAAVKEGRLPAAAVPAKFAERAARIEFDVPSLADAVLTLSESAEGTRWEAKTAALLALLD
jgi:hypothetical protein